MKTVLDIALGWPVFDICTDNLSGFASAISVLGHLSIVDNRSGVSDILSDMKT